MGTLLFALLLVKYHGTVVSGNSFWEETPIAQRGAGYHPMLRLNPGSTFKVATPYYPAEGHYQVSDNHLAFTPETAIQINHADVDKLIVGLDPEVAKQKVDNYNKSLSAFDATYSDAETLTLNYRVGGMQKHFELHPVDYGDNNRTSLVSGPETVVPGIWWAPEPFPDRLDSKTRFRIDGIDGLKKFSEEGSASDGAQFAVFDIRNDRTFRIHAKQGSWKLEGRTVVLKMGMGEMRLDLSSDNMDLLSGGKRFLTRKPQ